MGKPTLRQHAYGSIQGWIENGQLVKGTMTSEVQLCRSLDMSRTPVRAALQQLELEGYLRIVSKHGVLILDSSSQRVSDLLELIVSLSLFAVGSLWISEQQEDLIHFSEQKEDVFQKLLNSQEGTEKEFIQFEYELLRDLLALCHNAELEHLFQTVTRRLFWQHNEKRWHTLYRLNTQKHVNMLILSTAKGPEPFREAIFSYISSLKRTWI